MNNKNTVDPQQLAAPISRLKRTEEKISNEKINILYKHLPVSIFSAFICASILFFGLQEFLHAYFLKYWYISITIVLLFRLALLPLLKFKPEKTNVHLVLFILGSTLSATCWGVIDSLLMPIHNQVGQMLIIIIIAGVSAGAVQTLQANLFASILYLIFTITPLCIWLFMQEGVKYFILSSTMIIYLLFMLISAYRAYHLLNKVLTLHHTNMELVENTHKSNKVLKDKNILLELHERDMIIINKMNETLQLCQSSFEAYSAIKIAAEKLFIDLNGGLTISDLFYNQDLAVQWGKREIIQKNFPSDHCWGLRSGDRYLVHNTQTDLNCQHYITAPSVSCCMPLIVYNKVFGMVNFNSSTKMDITNHMQQVMISFCNVIKLALANIKLHEKLQLEATHDPLTNLFNRRYLNETLARELQRVIHEKNSLCVAMLDLDFFKEFNDIYGHEAGDEVLKYISNVLVTKIRGNDIACRFGGEEFVLVFINTEIDKVMPYLEHIQEEIEKGKIYFRDKLLPQVTVSIGVAEAPKHGTTVEEIIQEADAAMYAAKNSGRDKIMIAKLA